MLLITNKNIILLKKIINVKKIKRLIIIIKQIIKRFNRKYNKWKNKIIIKNKITNKFIWFD